MNKIEVDIDEVAMLVDRGGEFVINPSAEDAILRLLEIQEMVESALEAVKTKIQEEGLALGDGFKGVKGDKISVIYRQYGAKYGFKEEFVGELEDFLRGKTTFTVDSDAVERFIKECGELPKGIYENDREHKLSISIREGRVR